MGAASKPIRVYIDGENLFIRTQEWLRKNYQKDISIQEYVEILDKKFQEDRKLFSSPPIPPLVKPECYFFWDFDRLIYNSLFYKTDVPKIYFTSFVGGEDELHACRLFLRQNDFEPHIIKENGQLADRRKNKLENEYLIESPKGVDIALSVRMLEDAYRNVYDECVLFSSDVDFLPIIEAVQRMGKLVSVFAFRNGMGKNSPLEYVPHRFADLGNEMENRCKSIR